QTSVSDQTAMKKGTDMSEKMQQHAVECAILAIEKYDVERGFSGLIKRVNLEKKESPTWHCIVGRKFGSYMSHEAKHFIFFLMLGVNILLFKAG
ncbi:Dynein light chain 2, cytoplasmic, partial [Phaethon lepturus]